MKLRAKLDRQDEWWVLYEPTMMLYCDNCKEVTMHKLRAKAMLNQKTVYLIYECENCLSFWTSDNNNLVKLLRRKRRDERRD